MGRIVELDKLKSFLEFNLNEQLLIASTYFTSKKDPNRKIYHQNDNFDYIKKWYNSVDDFDLRAIIFHDNLSEKFLKKHEKCRIKFIKVNLLEYSVNDERFFIFQELTSFMSKSQFLLITDINDVEVNRHPLEILSKSAEKIYVGLGDKKYWNQGIWNINKIKEFQKITKLKIPTEFLFFPVFNAGLIGGKTNNLHLFFKKMNYYFELAGDSGNYNMVVLNWVIFNYYQNPNRFKIPVGSFNLLCEFYIQQHIIKQLILRRKYDPFDYQSLPYFENDYIFSGFPFNSGFRKMEKRNISKAYLIHK